MKQHFITAITSLLIFLWVYTAVSKLAAFNTSLVFLQHSPFAGIATPMAIALPLTELLLAFLLVVPRTKLFALKLSLLLLLLFTAYIMYMLAFYEKLPCNCGGVINSMSWTQHLFFNLFFITLIIISLKIKPTGHRCHAGALEAHKIVDQPGQAEHLKTK